MSLLSSPVVTERFRLCYVRSFIRPKYMVCGPARNRRCLGSGRPRRHSKPFQTVGGNALDLKEWFVGPPGPPRSPRIDDFRPAQKPCIKNPSVWHPIGGRAYRRASEVCHVGSKPSPRPRGGRSASTEVVGSEGAKNTLRVSSEAVNFTLLDPFDQKNTWPSFQRSRQL